MFGLHFALRGTFKFIRQLSALKIILNFVCRFFSLIQGETSANGNSKVRIEFWLEASPLLFG